uniref:Uncharacterized protein n=1 Tax=Prolemur simus TaxID=1328070 RepID=A0A8C9DQ16_PROSS
MHKCAAALESTAPETATPTWGAADTRVKAAFQEANKKEKKKRERKRKRRASGEQGPRPPPTRAPRLVLVPGAGRPAAALLSAAARWPQTPRPARRNPLASALRCVPRPCRSLRRH